MAVLDTTDDPYWMQESGYDCFPSQRRYRRAMYAAEKLGEMKLFGGHVYEGEHVGMDSETYDIRIDIRDSPFARLMNVPPDLRVYSNGELVYKEVLNEEMNDPVMVDEGSDGGTNAWEHILDCLHHRAREQEREERRNGEGPVMPGPLQGVIELFSSE